MGLETKLRHVDISEGEVTDAEQSAPKSYDKVTAYLQNLLELPSKREFEEYIRTMLGVDDVCLISAKEKTGEHVYLLRDEIERDGKIQKKSAILKCFIPPAEMTARERKKNLKLFKEQMCFAVALGKDETHFAKTISFGTLQPSVENLKETLNCYFRRKAENYGRPVENSELCIVADILGNNQHYPYELKHFITEYGRPLTQILEKNHLRTNTKLGFALNIGEALEIMHTKWLSVHGDVSAKNVVVDETGKAKLIDFGETRFVEEEASKYFTNDYTHPSDVVARKKGEIVFSEYKNDIFSYGLLLYELFSTKSPQPVRNGEKQPFVSTGNANLDARLQDIICKATIDPDARYKSMTHLLQSIRGAIMQYRQDAVAEPAEKEYAESAS